MTVVLLCQRKDLLLITIFIAYFFFINNMNIKIQNYTRLHKTLTLAINSQSPGKLPHEDYQALYIDTFHQNDAIL